MGSVPRQKDVDTRFLLLLPRKQSLQFPFPPWRTMSHDSSGITLQFFRAICRDNAYKHPVKAVLGAAELVGGWDLQLSCFKIVGKRSLDLWSAGTKWA